MSRAAQLLAGVVAATTDQPGADGDARTSTGLHAMAAVARLRLGTPGAEGAPDVPITEIASSGSAVEAALRDALRQLVQLTPATFDTDPVLDAVAEIQAALAATG